jgi:hypothetical protein
VLVEVVEPVELELDKVELDKVELDKVELDRVEVGQPLEEMKLL